MASTRRDFLAAAAAASQPILAATPPNILFLFPDQLRHDFVEPSAEFPVRTPNIKRLVESGVRFTQAVTPSPLCAPARACLASGMEYDRCSVPSNGYNYPLDQPTFYQLLRRAGYHVMGCGKFDLHKKDLDWGLDGKRLIGEWGFSDGVDNEGKHDGTIAYQKNGRPMGPFLHYLEREGLAKTHIEDYAKRKGHGATFPTLLPDHAYGDNWIARNGLSLLEAAPRNTPWFLQVNFNGPHSPWDITARMQSQWRSTKFPQPNRNDQLTPENHVAVRQNYAAMIENIDQWVGEFLAKVKQRGEADRTLVVFSSDHGEMLGDHNLWGKTQPFHASVGVPLVVSGPRVLPRTTVTEPVTTLDLVATYLDFAGVQKPESMDSRSLRRLLEGKATNHREHVQSGLGPWRMVLQGDYRYIRGHSKGSMLFDRRNDPLENENLATAKPELAARLEKLLPALKP